MFNIKNPMYVCLCEGVSDREIKESIAAGASSVDDVALCTGAGSRCGSCRATIETLIEDHAEPHTRCEGRCIRLTVLTPAA